MKYDLVLINPSYKKVYGFKEDISSKLPPLGLMYLSSYLKMNGYKVKIIDLEVDDESELKRILNDSQVFGITSVTSTFPQARKIAKKIKQYNEESIVILGGPHASVCGKDIIEICREIDVVVCGEGELVLKKLLEQEFKNLNNIDGIIYRCRDDTKIVLKQVNLNFVNIDILPFPDHFGIDYSKYRPSIHRNVGFPFAVMITSRGCPFSCKYCGTQTIFGKSVRFRSVENVIEEVEHLIDNFKVQNIIFWDDTFTLNKQYVVELCYSLKKYNLAWSCNTRPDYIGKEILKKMKDAGCKIIFYGVESSNDKILGKLGRNMDINSIENAIKITKEIGIRCTASIMIGTPFDTKEQIEKNIEFMIKLDPDFAFFSPFAPHPGTPIYNFCVEKNIIPPWKEWLKINFKGVPLNHPVANKHLTRKEIQHYLEKAYNKFYSRKEFFKERKKWKEDWEIKILEHLRKKFQRVKNEEENSRTR